MSWTRFWTTRIGALWRDIPEDLGNFDSPAYSDLMAEHVADPEVLLVDQRRPCLRARLEQFINTLKIGGRVATRYDHLPPRVSSARPARRNPTVD